MEPAPIYRRASPWVFAALSALCTFAALPGLTGSWVGDDFGMLSSPLYGSSAEVWRVFTRHAGDYIGAPIQPGAIYPYRPVTMFTLLASHALLPVPWLHHLVGWALHLATAAMLWRLLARQSPDRSEAGVGTAILAGVFLLHPVTVETYVWINGRSDLVAGLCLMALGTVLSRSLRDPERPTGWVLAAAVLSFLGAGAKLPFAMAAAALWLGLALREHSRRSGGEQLPASADERPWRRAAWQLGAAVCVGVVAHLWLRSTLVPFFGPIGSADGGLVDPQLWRSVPQLFAISAEALLSFRAAAMRSLAWALFTPLGASAWVCSLTMLGAVGAMAWKRDLGGVVLVGGAAASVAPCVAVSTSIWLGFDRYLYMALALMLLAAAPYATAAWQAAAGRRAVRGLVLGAVLLAAALGTRTASLAYEGQLAYERAMLSDYPDDPTIFFYLARLAKNNGLDERARNSLAAMPPPPWPRALVLPVFGVAGAVDATATLALAADHALANYADDPTQRAYAMRVKFDQGDLETALQVARTFSGDPLCPEVRRQLVLWKRRPSMAAHKTAIEDTLAGLGCTAHSP